MTQNQTTGEWLPLKGVDPNCFACGNENTQGLQMTFETNGEKVRSSLKVPGHLRGWDNLVHGGVLSTLIDEAMSWAAIHLHKRFILTKSMQVQFKKPVRIETPLMVYGYVLEKSGDRHVTMRADIHDESGAVCASGTGEFVLFTTEQFKSLNLMEPDLLSDMARGFE